MALAEPVSGCRATAAIVDLHKTLLQDGKSGAFYAWEPRFGDAVTTKSLRGFINAFAEGELPRQSLGD